MDVSPEPLFFIALVKLLLFAAAALLLVSGLDDLFMDIVFAARALYRRFVVLRRHAPLTEEHLLWPLEQPAAVLIPAWEAEGVIGPMLDHMRRALHYDHYHVFVGVHLNDGATEREVREAAARHESVHCVTLTAPGAASRASCLNRLLEAARVFERSHGPEFGFFVVHDAGDIPHPLSLRAMNYLIPRKDMVQLPLFPLPAERPTALVTGHFMGEFAENHVKTLVAQEVVGGSATSVGVGCAFSRRAIEALSRAFFGQPFREDGPSGGFDVGALLAEQGMKSVFMRAAVRRGRGESFGPGEGRRAGVPAAEFIATWERFPRTFWAAIREKARWFLGFMPGVSRGAGCRGNFGARYMIARDRKAAFMPLVNAVVWCAGLTLLGVWAWSLRALPTPIPIADLSGPWGLLVWLLAADAVLILERMAVRAACVARVYGSRDALCAPLWHVFGGLVNLFAALRALVLFFRRPAREPDRVRPFPSEAEIRAAVGEGGASAGVVGPPAAGWADHLESSLELLRSFPRELAARHSVFPVAVDSRGGLVLASATGLQPDEARAIEAAVHRPVSFVSASETEVREAIRSGYERLDSHADGPRIGQVLVGMGLVNEEQLEKVLQEQRRRSMRLGDVIVAEGMMSRGRLELALAAFSPALHGRIGDFLLREGLISLEDLKRAVAIQEARAKPLGDLLVDLGFIRRADLGRALNEQARASRADAAENSGPENP